MTAATAEPRPGTLEDTEPQSEWALVWARLRTKRLAMLSLVIIAIIYGAGITAPWLAPYGYSVVDLDRGLEGPSADHWLGTDRLGRDMLSRVMYSSLTTLVVTATVILSGSLIIGNGLGLLAGYRGGWVDSAIMRIGEVFSSLPALPMIILISASLNTRVINATRWLDDRTFFDGWLQTTGVASYLLVFGALSLFFWVGTARIIRAQVLALREREFIMAAQAIGASPRRIITRHLLPNVSFLIVLQISATMGGIAGSEILLSWLGVGVQPPAASFGQMLFQGSGARTFQAHPHLLLVPGVVVTLLLFAFNLLGDALNDAMRSR